MKLIRKELISKGFSADRKFCVTDECGVKYLLRQADISEKTQKTAEFHIMQRLDALGLSMCRPVKLWWDEKSVYTLHQWIDGEDLENVLPQLSQQEQYGLGLETGRQLRIIHSVPAADGAKPWAERYAQKVERTLENYEQCGLKCEQEKFLLGQIQTDLPLLKTRPTVLQHGDFHRANLMVDRQGHPVLIDFQKLGWGDPWEEFDSITWDVQLSPAFARGRVDGYFEDCPPADFWRLLRLYVCRCVLHGWSWASARGDEQLDIMRSHAAMVQKWYADGNTIPSWYRPLGLKRGTVHLESHDPCWSAMAAQCIHQLKMLLGETAVDIQHVGSTAVHAIHAKPILDIAVGISALENVEKYIPVLEQHHIIYRGQDHPGQLLFVKGDFEQDTRTHHIHVVVHGSDVWKNYLNFRDYLNGCPEKAGEYDGLKRSLAEQYGKDRAAYTAGKGQLVSSLLAEARQWRTDRQKKAT